MSKMETACSPHSWQLHVDLRFGFAIVSWTCRHCGYLVPGPMARIREEGDWDRLRSS